MSKFIVIPLIILLLFSVVCTSENTLYAFEPMEQLLNEGDSIEKTFSQGTEWEFTSSLKATYTIELYGPASLGTNPGYGGLVLAPIILDEGQTIAFKLGPRVPAKNGVRDGTKGNDGSGKNEVGNYKSEAYLDGELIIVSGGGGSAGNPGTGDGAKISEENIYMEVEPVVFVL